MMSPSILIVDDEPDNFDVIEAFLNGQNYELHYVSNGKDAIASLPTFRPDVILLDVMMPGIDGIQVCQKIKAMALWSSVPIIMVTALNTKEDLARCLAAGADDFISKPVNAIELRSRIHSMLRIKQQYDKIQSFSKLQRDTINILGNNLQELRGNLASSLPHELNTPLNGILGGIGLLLSDFEKMSSEEVRELLDISYASAIRLDKLTQKFLLYLQLELTPIRPETDTVNIISSLIEHLAKTKAAQVQRLEDLSLDVQSVDVDINSSYLQRLIEELLENAFKFSQPGTLVKLEGHSSQGMFHIQLSDHGCGMTHEQIASIGAFMQFKRDVNEQQGSGLGLPIVQKIVQLYGGRFWITSIDQQETTVHVTLPLIAPVLAE